MKRDDLKDRIEQAFVDAFRDHPGDTETVYGEVASWVKRTCRDDVWERWGHAFMGFWWRYLCRDERRERLLPDESDALPSSGTTSAARFQPRPPGTRKVLAAALNDPAAIYRCRFQVAGIGPVALGDMTAEHSEALRERYRKHKEGNARGEQFFAAITKALAHAKAKTVREAYHGHEEKLTSLWRRFQDGGDE